MEKIHAKDQFSVDERVHFNLGGSGTERRTGIGAQNDH
jgi:hypothetical protein